MYTYPAPKYFPHFQAFNIRTHPFNVLLLNIYSVQALWNELGHTGKGSTVLTLR